MNAGPTGFAGAPVTKGLLVCVTGSSVLVQASHSLRGQLPRLLRSAGHLLIFEHPGVLIFGTALLYYFRLFERQWGSNKYGTFTAFVFGSAYVLEQAAIKLLGWIPAPIPGPFPLIFANYVPFFFDVPATQRFQLFGLPLTDKAFVYMAGVQLLFTSSRRSLLGAACGLLAGLAYKSNLFGLQKLQVPKAVSSFLGSTFGRLLSATVAAPRAPTLPNGPPAPASSQQANAPPLPQASQQALEQLVAMGFDERRAAYALQTSHNDVQTALAQLL